MPNAWRLGPAAAAKHRISALAHWARRRDQLAPRAAHWRQALGPGAARVLAGRILLLLRDMLGSAGHHGRALPGDTISGFRAAWGAPA